MPNITLYLTDEQYDDFRELDEQKQSEAREEAIKTLIKVVNKFKS